MDHMAKIEHVSPRAGDTAAPQHPLVSSEAGLVKYCAVYACNVYSPFDMFETTGNTDCDPWLALYELACMT